MPCLSQILNLKFVEIFGNMKNFDFLADQPVMHIFPWKWSEKQGIMFLASFETNTVWIYAWNFRINEISRSLDKIWPFLNMRNFTFLGICAICALIWENLKFLIKLHTSSYVLWKYEGNRRWTHKMRATSKNAFLLSHHGKV